MTYNEVTEDMVKICSSFVQKVVREILRAGSQYSRHLLSLTKRVDKKKKKTIDKINSTVSYNRKEQREIPKQSRAGSSTFATSEPRTANTAVQPRTLPDKNSWFSCHTSP